MADYAKIKQELEGIAVEDNPALVRQKSRDFYWYSPILKEELDSVTGDLVVSPTTEEEVIRTLKVAFAHGVPVTPRGAGTGNYGQAMPLSGGIVLNLINMNKVKEIHPGRVICEPGIIIAELDRRRRPIPARASFPPLDCTDGDDWRLYRRRFRWRRLHPLGRSPRSRQHP